MNPFLQYYFMIPFAGFLADLAVLLLLFSLRENKKQYWPLFGYYATLCLWNLAVSALFLATTEYQAQWILYVIHHFIPFYSLAFLWAAMHFSGRSWTLPVHAATIMPLILYGIIDYSFWFTPDNTLFISGLHKYNWGYYPLNGFGSTLYTLMSIYCLLLGIYYYARPTKNTPILRTTRFYLILAWLGISTSFLPTFGLAIFPVGNATDAIISVFMAASLFRQESLQPRSRLYLRVAGTVTAIAVALMVSWGCTEVLPISNRFLSALLTVLGACIGIFSFQKIFKPHSVVDTIHSEITESSLFAILQVKYRLTYQETTICTLIANGESRPEICEHANITTNTLKVHLASIYRKTIDRDSLFRNKSRDKLQRLTVFLQKIEKKRDP